MCRYNDAFVLHKQSKDHFQEFLREADPRTFDYEHLILCMKDEDEDNRNAALAMLKCIPSSHLDRAVLLGYANSPNAEVQKTAEMLFASQPVESVRQVARLFRK